MSSEIAKKIAEMFWPMMESNSLLAKDAWIDEAAKRIIELYEKLKVAE